jgi:hypothetical protein
MIALVGVHIGFISEEFFASGNLRVSGYIAEVPRNFQGFLFRSFFFSKHFSLFLFFKKFFVFYSTMQTEEENQLDRQVAAYFGANLKRIQRLASQGHPEVLQAGNIILQESCRPVDWIVRTLASAVAQPIVRHTVGFFGTLFQLGSKAGFLYPHETVGTFVSDTPDSYSWKDLTGQIHSFPKVEKISEGVRSFDEYYEPSSPTYLQTNILPEDRLFLKSQIRPESRINGADEVRLENHPFLTQDSLGRLSVTPYSSKFALYELRSYLLVTAVLSDLPWLVEQISRLRKKQITVERLLADASCRMVGHLAGSLAFVVGSVLVVGIVSDYYPEGNTAASQTIIFNLRSILGYLSDMLGSAAEQRVRAVFETQTEENYYQV